MSIYVLDLDLEPASLTLYVSCAPCLLLPSLLCFYSCERLLYAIEFVAIV